LVSNEINFAAVYITNSSLVAIGVAVLSLFMGLIPALLLHKYIFRGSAVLPVLLVLPLAVPAYIRGLSYRAMLDYASPWYTFLRGHFG
jgi:ABC-type Fe3+ transport system permease subunit